MSTWVRLGFEGALGRLGLVPGHTDTGRGGRPCLSTPRCCAARPGAVAKRPKSMTHRAPGASRTPKRLPWGRGVGVAFRCGITPKRQFHIRCGSNCWY